VRASPSIRSYRVARRRAEALPTPAPPPAVPEAKPYRDGFAGRYTQARERLMDTWAEELVRIADDPNLEPNDRRVRVDTRKWLMSKLAYRRYGDKLVHSGDPENPIQVLHKKAEMAPLTPSQLALLERFAEERLTVIDAEAEPEGDGGRVPISPPMHPKAN
jgi:hypothetical protein